ncbi:MAG: SRPBCC family protein [Actinomycetota bacterium]|nr:SRPBCC family protein [Actinomycetota bacterium]
MEFVNQFVVPAPVAEAWTLLTDVPRIAPCLPGATVREVGDGYEGNVTVKVGPIKVGYAGVASFTTLDEASRTMVLDARGKENSGRGSAAAVVHVNLTPEGTGRTAVQVRTDLQITGKVAQFGRSAMADVGERLIGQFASNLESLLGAGATTPGAGQGGTGEASGSAGASAGAELNALSLAAPLLKRAVPSVVALIVGIVIGRLLGRSRSPRALSPGVLVVDSAAN